MEKFLGLPYPVVRNPLGLFKSQGGIEQIKSDLKVLLLTNPGERVMLPNFGTPLKKILFDQNDSTVKIQARNMILQSIRDWEPRIEPIQVQVFDSADVNELSIYDDRTEVDHILYIKITFIDPENIKEVQSLELKIPLSGE